jgi:transcriptional regulator with XRE-family HTH domain
MLGVDDRRVGLIVRMLRSRRGWRQLDLAARGGCSQSFVSQLERGHIDRASLADVRRVLGALDAKWAPIDPQYAASLRMPAAIFSGSIMNQSSRTWLYGTPGTSGPAIRVTGPSR